MEPIRDLLKRELADALEALSPADRLAAAWPVSAGHAIAMHSRITGFENQICTIEVDAPEWIGQLEAMQTSLTAQLAAIAKVPVRALHFKKKS